MQLIKKLILSFVCITILLEYSCQPQLNLIRPHAELINLIMSDIIKKAWYGHNVYYQKHVHQSLCFPRKLQLLKLEQNFALF